MVGFENHCATSSDVLEIQNRRYALITGQDVTERKQVEEDREKALHDTSKRVKELGCLYGLSNLIEKQDSLDDIINGLIDIVPTGWQYPEIACCRIIINGREFIKSSDFVQTEWKQIAEIHIANQQSGSIAVFYKEQCPEEVEGPFLKEERDLINALAERISRIIERKQAEETLAKHKIYLDDIVEQRTSELESANRQLEGKIAESKRAAESMRQMALFAELNPAPVLRFDKELNILNSNTAAKTIRRFLFLGSDDVAGTAERNQKILAIIADQELA